MQAIINTGKFNGRYPYVQSYSKNKFELTKEIKSSLKGEFIEILDITEEEYNYFVTIPNEDIQYLHYHENQDISKYWWIADGSKRFEF